MVDLEEGFVECSAAPDPALARLNRPELMVKKLPPPLPNPPPPPPQPGNLLPSHFGKTRGCHGCGNSRAILILNNGTRPHVCFRPDSE